MLQFKFPFRLVTVNSYTCGCFYSVQSSENLTYYAILKVKPTASQKEIRKAFLEKSKLLHPDATSSSNRDTHKEFILLNEAYSVLNKPDKRREYDAMLRQKEIYSQSSFENPHRSPNYKSPYTNFNDRRHNNPTWTDYYTSNAQKRAKYNMEQNINNDFWQTHWKFTKNHGGGGPNLASHDQSVLTEIYTKSRDSKFMFGVIVILVIISYMPVLFSDNMKTEIEDINKQYESWLIEKIDHQETLTETNLEEQK